MSAPDQVVEDLSLEADALDKLEKLKINEFPFTKTKRLNDKEFLPLEPNFKEFFNLIISDEELVNKIYWTKATVFDPDFIIKRIELAPKKKWNWWYLCKQLPLNNILELTLIEDAIINMDGLSANTNLTVEFYKKYDKWQWNNKFLCANQVFSPETILELKIPIDANYLSKNINLTKKFVDEHPEISWNIRYLTINPGTKEDIFKEPFPDMICYINYSDREEINEEFYKNHTNYFYDFNKLANRFSLEFIFNEIKNNRFSMFNNFWPIISMRKDVNMDVVRKNPGYPWCYRTLCLNENIDHWEMKIYEEKEYIPMLIKTLQSFEDENWKDFNFTDNENFINDIRKYIRVRKGNKKLRINITQQFIEDAKYILSLINEGVNWKNLSHNFKGDWKFIIENCKKPLDWKYLSRIATVDIIREYPTELWDMDEFSEYADVDIKFLEDNKDICWSWKGLSRNKKFNYKTIYENKDKNWIIHNMCLLPVYNKRIHDM